MVWSLELQKLEGHTGTVRAVAFSTDGRLLASASKDKTVRLWDPSTGREVQKLKGHTDWVNAVGFSPDGRLLASASDDKTVRLWDASTGREVQKLEGHTDWVNAVGFSPDGRLLASGSKDKTVRLWDASTGREVQKLEGHTSTVNAVAFSPDGRLLASASSWDTTVRLWDPSTGREVQKLENIPEISSLSFTADDKILLTDRGALSIHEPITLTARGPFTHNTIMVKNDWIQQGDRNFLWLPQEYRTARFAFHGDMLAFGQNSGQISFIQFNEF